MMHHTRCPMSHTMHTHPLPRCSPDPLSRRPRTSWTRRQQGACSFINVRFDFPHMRSGLPRKCVFEVCSSSRFCKKLIMPAGIQAHCVNKPNRHSGFYTDSGSQCQQIYISCRILLWIWCLFLLPTCFRVILFPWWVLEMFFFNKFWSNVIF